MTTHPEAAPARAELIERPTEPVSDLIKRLRAGKADRRGYVVVWVENFQAFIDTEMFRSFPEWRKIFREEFDALKAAAEEAADLIEAQTAALSLAESRGRQIGREEAAAWQPIETAPSDVHLLLSWWELWPFPGWRTEVSIYHSTKGGWLHSQATHWMKLPAPVPLPTKSSAAAIRNLPTNRALSNKGAI